MSVAGKWFVTPHAVARYIERVRPGASYETALRELVRESETARPVKEIEPGLWLYRGAKPRRLRYRVSTREPGLPQLVTVLRTFDGCRSGRC